MKVPDFFLVGAPKCGTTALSIWLSCHPDVCISQPKETQFFAEDVCGNQRNITELESYLRCFGDPARQKLWGEASTIHLSSPSAAERIKAFNPQAKILVLLRNPIDVMHAEHSTRLQGCIEQIRDFAAALDSAAPRKWKDRKFRGQVVRRPNYRQLVQFPEQLQRYFRVFGRERVHVSIYDDLLSDPSGVYRSVLTFLELRNDGRQDFSRVNANRRVRSMTVQEFLEYPGTRIRSAARLLMPPSVRTFGAGIVRRLNLVEEPRRVLPPALRQRLMAEFEPEVRSLSDLLGRDLSVWCQK